MIHFTIRSIRILLVGIFVTSCSVSPVDRENEQYQSSGDIRPANSHSAQQSEFDDFSGKSVFFETPTMPALFGERMDGSLFSTSQLPKRARVVNFFWVGCEPCRKEIPLLARKEQLYPNVDFVLVHLEPNEQGEDYPLSEIRAYINSLPASPENTIRVTKRMKEELGIQAYPMTALVAADGKIEKLLTGLTPEVQRTLEVWLKRQ